MYYNTKSQSISVLLYVQYNKFTKKASMEMSCCKYYLVTGI